MKHRYIAAVALLIIAAPARARAGDECHVRGDALGWYVPDHVKVQTGGMLGFLTIAVGYSAFGWLDIDTYFGWVPEPIGGTDIHSLALRAGAHVQPLCLGSSLSWTYLTGGVGAVMAFGDGFFLSGPDRYPDGYYAETAVRGLLVLGSELALHRSDESFVALHAVFLELTALDEYLIAWLKNPGEIAPWEAWSFSFGYKAGF